MSENEKNEKPQYGSPDHLWAVAKALNVQAKCNSVFLKGRNDEDRCVHRVLYMSKVRVIVAKVEGGDTLQVYEKHLDSFVDRNGKRLVATFDEYEAGRPESNE